MASDTRNLGSVAVQAGQTASVLLLTGLAFGAFVWTCAAAAGLLPWLSLGDVANGVGAPAAIPAGIVLQLTTTAVLLALVAIVPGCLRVQALERDHRKFVLSMADVAEAYAAVHAADRAGLFGMAREFDSMRERLGYLRAHPDLSDLEPEILELAAQMSHESRDLAAAFSDETVSRARRFLQQREEEAARFEQALEAAQAATTELRCWLDRVEMDEAVGRSRLTRLQEDLDAVLPRIGLGLVARPGANVTPMRHAAE